MAYTPKSAYESQPGTGATTIYTAPAGPATPNTAAAIIKEIVLVNTSGAAAWITLGIGGVAAANASIAYQMNIPTAGPSSNNTVVLALSKVMNANATLQAIQQTAGAITVSVSVEEGS